MREQMRALSSAPREVDRRSGLTSAEFLEDYYSQNTPVIMDDVCVNWPARALWNPEYLVAKLGGVEVEVMSDRDSDPNYEINSNEHKFMMRFDEYVAKIEVAGQSNDLYLVANNKLLGTPAADALWNDFELDQRFLAPDPDHGQAYLWFGPGGTITPLHHDTLNVLFNQVAGHKHFILIPSLAIHRLYNNLAVYSEVDPLRPDLERHPLFAGVHPIHFDIGPGESLFIPAGWWHHVVSYDTSLSVSFTNFCFDNNIEWVHPSFSL
jgi:ribosomal protein L16 Arg81 hydroxylase